MINSLVYLLLAWYFDKVLPSEYGTSEPVYFFLSPWFWLGWSRTEADPGPYVEGEEALELDGRGDDEVDVCRIAKDVLLRTEAETDEMIQIKRLRKFFQGGHFCAKKTFKAVRDVSYSVKKNELFCLLGPNVRLAVRVAERLARCA